MYVTPSIEDLIEGAIYTLKNQVRSDIGNLTTQVKLDFAVVLLQNALQVVPKEREKFIEECNGMTSMFTDLKKSLEGSKHPRAKALVKNIESVVNSKKKITEVITREALQREHSELGALFKPCIETIDELLTSGHSEGNLALKNIRGYLHTKVSGTDFPLYAVNPGSMPGRE